MESRIAPLNLNELVDISTSLQSLVGAQLQECVQTDREEMGLGFYHEGKILWLWFDLKPQRPLVLKFEGKHPQRKKVTRPLSLFLKSRFLGRRVESVHVDLRRGRVLAFRFHRSKAEDADGLPELEFRLIPHGQNILARDGQSQVSNDKPKDLPPSAFEAQADLKVRTWDEIQSSWMILQQPQKNAQASTAQDAEKKWKRAIEKKQAALERMELELGEKTSGVERELGEKIKAEGSLGFPADWPKERFEIWQKLIDPDESLSANIERLFTKAKDKERKSDGTRARILTVQKELAELQSKGIRAFEKNLERDEKKENFLNKAEVRGRRHVVASDLECYIGKNAADNLALLRRAQPFDYWLHLRERPGSHAILRRTKNRNVTDAEFAEAGRWVVEQSLGKRAREIEGERFDLLIVECRYVKPIKGDKLGRVNYTNDRVLRLRF